MADSFDVGTLLSQVAFVKYTIAIRLGSRVGKLKNKLVIIEWEDSAQPTPAWELRANFKSPSVVKIATAGWLVHDGKKVKAVAQNVGGLDGKVAAQMSGVISIPTRCIISINRLTERG